MDRSPKLLDLTSDGIVFAEWDTAVANDSLTLVGTTFVGSSWVDFPGEGFGLSDPDATERDFDLEAVFLSQEKRATVRIKFRRVRAHRVLDESGLCELWNAAAERPRPAQTTFKVRGHSWQAESPLAWAMDSGTGYFSYVVATECDCIEVVCAAEPTVEIEPAVVRLLD